jgi:hypothetical protein
MMGGDMAQSNALADRDEAFNTRLGSMRGWQMATYDASKRGTGTVAGNAPRRRIVLGASLF